MPGDNTYDQVTEVDPFTDPRVDIDDMPIEWSGERYERIGRIGEGGMGDVQLAKDTRIARSVAMKLLRKSLRNEPDYRRRFLFEARLQGQLEHPAIVPVHDLGETPDGELFFTMKRIRGVTLANALQDLRDEVGTFTKRRLLTAFSNVCLAVDFAHTRGVVHRDLKPQNIMLGDFGEVYVLDWGIAKLIGSTDTPLGDVVDVPGADTPTRAGSTLGTPQYMAPERERGVTDPRTDVYSLGVILGEILEADDDIAPELASITRHATQKERELRFHTARELHYAVEHYLDGDRDLEARRNLSAQHALRAEHALAAAKNDPAARTTTAREVSRALGLDPSNAQALRILMRLLSDVPNELPPAAQQEIDRRWLLRRARTMRIGAVSTAALLMAVPFVLWLGVRNWSLLIVFIGMVMVASAVQWFAAAKPTGWRFAAAFVIQTASTATLTVSMGLLGLVPAGFTIATVAWRQTVARTSHSLLLLLVVLTAIVAPLVLTAAGVLAPSYVFEHGRLAIVPQMHELPPVKTLVYVVTVTFGVIAAGAIYGRLFVAEVRRAESQLTFQAWQLQQLLPPEPVR